MFRQRILSSFALALLFVPSVSAQTPDDQSPLSQQEKEQKIAEAKKELEKRTFALLDEVVGSAQTLKIPENRALVLSSAADLLWTRDEKRARTLFRDAISNLNIVGLRADEQMSADQRRSFAMLMQQREEILQLVARHDADLALELLRASRPQPQPSPAQPAGPKPFDYELRVEQSLVNQIAASDPKRAFQMAEDSLSKGLSTELIRTLSRLNSKDKELAARLASDIISKLQSQNLSTNPEAAWMAMLLLQAGVQPEGDGPGVILGSAGSYEAVSPLRLDERQLRDLLELVTTAAMSATPNPTLFNFLPALMPEIEKRFPERAPALRLRIAEAVRTLEPRERMFVQYQEVMQRGSVEAILEAAAKAPDKESQMLYENAAWKALYGGDEERARKIVNDNIKDSGARDRIIESFDRASLFQSMRKGKLDAVRKMLARIKSKDERASVLAQLAFGAALKKDRKLALELLEEARPLVQFKPKNDAQLYTLLQVVRVYALVEPAKAFEMIESLVDQANELLAAASVLNGFLLPSGVFKKGELVLSPGYSQISMQFRQFGKELAALALLNFDRTKAAADKFQRNEARIMARLFIVQGVLQEQLGSGVALYEEGVMAGY